MTDKYRQKLSTIIPIAFDGNVPFGALDLIATSAQYLTDYIQPCLTVIRVLTVNHPRPASSKVADALAALAKVSPASLVTPDFEWISFALREPPSPHIILAAVAISCVLPPDESIGPVLNAVGDAFTRCLSPATDSDDLNALAKWVIPVIRASPARAPFVPFCEALMARIFGAINPALWRDPEAQSRLARLIDCAFTGKWFGDAEFAREWLIAIVDSAPIAEHALVARHCIEAPIEPIWTFLHGPSTNCRICLDGLAFIVEKIPGLAAACNWGLIVEAIRAEPAALPEGARVIAQIVAIAEVNVMDVIGHTIAGIGAGTGAGRVPVMGEMWITQAAGAVWAMCQAAAVRMRSRREIGRVLLAVVERIAAGFGDETYVREVGRKFVGAFMADKKADENIKPFFAEVAAITPHVNDKYGEDD